MYTEAPTESVQKAESRKLMVKLADFGLSRILTPGVSSGMSSDVGTKYFSAPEFFGPEYYTDPDLRDRIHYHKDIDIFATGLTFLVILNVSYKMPLMLPTTNMIEGTHSYSHKDPVGIGMSMSSRNLCGIEPFETHHGFTFFLGGGRV